MLSHTSSTVNSDIWNASMPAELASDITTKRPQLAGCEVICSDSEREAIAEWVAACPFGLILRHDPVCQSTFFETATYASELQARRAALQAQIETLRGGGK